jgi:hypothetical protein
MGGGAYLDKTAQGIVAAGTVFNPSYGQMAADSIAKEIEERQLVSPTASPQAIASGQDQASPATTADVIAPSEVRSADTRA